MPKPRFVERRKRQVRPKGIILARYRDEPVTPVYKRSKGSTPGAVPEGMYAPIPVGRRRYVRPGEKPFKGAAEDTRKGGDRRKGERREVRGNKIIPERFTNDPRLRPEVVAEWREKARAKGCFFLTHGEMRSLMEKVGWLRTTVWQGVHLKAAPRFLRTNGLELLEQPEVTGKKVGFIIRERRGGGERRRLAAGKRKARGK